jgi:hypothetical protein
MRLDVIRQQGRRGPAAAICSCQRLPQLAMTTLTEERKFLA